MVARHDLAVADTKDDPNGVVAIPGVADHIGRSGADGFDRRGRFELFQPGEGVAQGSCSLVIEALARLRHQPAHVRPDVGGVPL